MVIRELFIINEDGTKLYKTYSDNNKKILQVETGIVYDEAVDIDTSIYTYLETDEEIETEEEEAE